MPTFQDYLALARAGYKKKEIDELLTLQPTKEDTGTKGPAETEQKDVTQPEPEKVTEQPASGEVDESEDKNTNAQLQEQIRELQSKLAAIQAENTRKDNSGSKPEDPDETLREIARRFM